MKTAQKNQENSSAGKISKDFLLIFIISVLLISLIALGYAYISLAGIRETTPNNQSGDIETEVVQSLDSLLVIDESEDISVVRIENPDALREQSELFYRNAEVGQYLVVLENTQKILIYDREDNIIVNFSTFNINPDLIPDEDIPSSEKPLRVEIRYSKEVTDSQLEYLQEDISRMSDHYEITKISETDLEYIGYNLVILDKDAKPNLTSNFKNQLFSSPGRKEELNILPDGESDSDADVILIVGDLTRL